MKDRFNGDFYITAATVIPLLYITLFLQGEMIQNLSLRFTRVISKGIRFLAYWATRRSRWSERKPRISFSLGLLATVLISVLTVPIVLAIQAAALAGIVAEALSLWALYYQSDSATLRAIVLLLTLGLLLLVSANPTITVVRNLYTFEPSGPSGEFESSGKSALKPDSASGEESQVDATASDKTARLSTGLGWPPSNQSTMKDTVDNT